MARAKKRSEVRPEGGLLAGWVPSLQSLDALARLLPTLPTLPASLLPSFTLSEWLPLATRADLAELSDRLVRLERRLAEHERAHVPARTTRQSLSA
jgi:hypothetical protein